LIFGQAGRGEVPEAASFTAFNFAAQHFLFSSGRHRSTAGSRKRANSAHEILQRTPVVSVVTRAASHAAL